MGLYTSMMQQYKERLKKVAAFLKNKVPASLFDMTYYVNCRPSKLEDMYELDKRSGGTADPIGWLPKLFPNEFYCDDTTQFVGNIFVVKSVRGDELWDRLNIFFGLDDYYISKLFTLEGYNKRRVTPKDVAEKITDFIKYEM